jgi:hypothetical protein
MSVIRGTGGIPTEILNTMGRTEDGLALVVSGALRSIGLIGGGPGPELNDL